MRAWDVAFIGVPIPPQMRAVFKQFRVPGIPESADKLHITMVHLGKEVPIERVAQAAIVVYSTTKRTVPFSVRSNVITSFKRGNDGMPIIALLDSPGLHALRAALCSALDAAGIEYSKKFPEYRPHVTLAYADLDVQPPDRPISPVQWDVDEIVVWGGDNGANKVVAVLPLEGDVQAMTAMRVAARFERLFTASLANEFTSRFEKLMGYAPRNPPPQEVADFRHWIATNFKLTGRVPAEAKRAREDLERFWRSLELAASHGAVEGVFSRFYKEAWERDIVPQIPTIVQYLSSEGSGKAHTFEKQVGDRTYVNMVGAGEARLDDMIAVIEKVFSELRGWRKKALDGGIRVVFAGPKDFHGTASGTYKRAKDELWIRATAGGKIQRGGDNYGGLGYVITHELGHRYEEHHPVGINFDQGNWFTSPYSTKEGESFAELFALSNFGMREVHGKSFGHVLDAFESRMGHAVALPGEKA